MTEKTKPAPAAPTDKTQWQKITESADAKKRPCVAPGCDGFAVAKGLCWAHYNRARRGGDISKPVRAPKGSEDLADLPPTKVPAEVVAFLQWKAKTDKASLYATVRKALEEWYETQKPAKK